MPPRLRSVARLLQVTSHLTNRQLRRRALVIGVGEYAHLPSPIFAGNDAEDMCRCLARLGFQVTHVESPTRAKLTQAVERFRTGVKATDITLVYFSGHGGGSDGLNYLAASDAITVTDGPSLEWDVMGQIQAVQPQQTLIVLVDACRADLKAGLPLAHTTMTPIKEKDVLKAPLHVAFSTSPGSSTERSARLSNGCFTAALLKHLEAKNTDIREVLGKSLACVRVLTSEPPSMYFASRGRETLMLSRDVPLPVTEDVPGEGPAAVGSAPRLAMGAEVEIYLRRRLGLGGLEIEKLQELGALTFRLLRGVDRAQMQMAELPQAQIAKIQRDYPYISQRAETERVDAAEMLRLVRTTSSLSSLQLCMRAFPDAPDIQEAACAATAKTVRRDRASRMAAGSLEVTRDLHNVMKKHRSSPAVQVQACLAVCAVADGSWENQALAAKHGILHDLREAVHHLGDHQALVTHACRAIYLLTANSHDGRQVALEIGLPRALRKLLRLHEECLPVLVDALSALHHVTRALGDNEAALTIHEIEGVLKDIRAVMQEHITSALVQQHACGAVRSLVRTEEAEEVALQMRLMGDVQQAMRGFPLDAEVQRQACAAVSNLAANLPGAKELAAELGLVTDLYNAMTYHPANTEVQEQAFWGLLNLTHKNRDNQVKAGRLGVLGEVQAFRNGQLEKGILQPVQEAAGWALVRNITHNNEENKVLASKLGLLEEQEQAMQAEINTGSPVDKALWAIKCIHSTQSSISPAKQVQNLGELQSLMRAHRQTPAVQEQACAALWSLTVSNNTGKTLAGRSGILVDVKESMEVHYLQESVMVQACWAVSNCTYNVLANKIACGREGICAIIIRSVLANSGSPKLSEAGCLAVRNIIQGCPEEAINVSSRDLLQAAIACASKHRDSGPINEHCMWLMRYTAAVNAKRQNTEMGQLLGLAMPVIQRTMRRCRKNSATQEYACGAVMQIIRSRKGSDAPGECRVLQDEAGLLGVMRDIQAAMRFHRNCANLQAQAMGALEGLTTDNTENQEQGKLLGISLDVFTAMQKHRAMMDLQQAASRILHSLNDNLKQFASAALGVQQEESKVKGIELMRSPLRPKSAGTLMRPVSDDYLKMVANSQDIMFIQQAMRTFPLDTGVQEFACRALGNLTSGNQDAQLAVLEADVLDDVQQAIRRHKRVLPVQEQALRCLKFAMRGAEGRLSRNRRANIVSHICDTIRAHRGHPLVLEQACLALISATLDDEPSKTEAIRLGALTELKVTMQAFMANLTIQESVAWAILELLANNREGGRREALRLGLLRDIEGAAKMHHKSDNLSAIATQIRQMLMTDVMNLFVSLTDAGQKKKTDGDNGNKDEDQEATGLFLPPISTPGSGALAGALQQPRQSSEDGPASRGGISSAGLSSLRFTPPSLA